jgi:hypothetical protein
MKSNVSMAILKHVNIDGAFFALNATYKVPYMSNITITNCIHGIQAFHIKNKFELVDSLINDNLMSGVIITKSHSDVIIHNSSFVRTSMGAGLSIEEDLVPIDFCTWNQSLTPVYPLVFRASSDHNGAQCSKVSYISIKKHDSWK